MAVRFLHYTYTAKFPDTHVELDFHAAHCLSPQIFRDTHSAPSADDSEFSPAVIERAMEGQMKRRGRKFAESDAFFGGLGRGADKFRIFRRFLCLP
jgi:hypothetical protein